jgi:hypothetical protein
VRAAVRRMAALQIDSIHVVARSPYLVLWSRLGDYDPAWLDQLLAAGDVFENWAHAACFLPREHYGFYRSRMLAGNHRWRSRSEPWMDAHRALVERVLGRIREEGPLRSADFERTDGRKGGGWWDWKEEKLALELLLTSGALMVRRRQNFQRVYDLRERVRPEWSDGDVPPLEEAQAALLVESVRALGVAKPAWVVPYLFLVQPKTPLLRTLRDLVASGTLQEVEVDGDPEPWLAVPGFRDLLDGPQRDASASLLSPFDPVVWDRARALELFGFDYRIECYTPAAERRFGYFSLPILYGDEIVGRLDARALRKEGVFEVRSLHLEDGISPGPELVSALRDVLGRCAAWHRTPEVVVREANRPALAEALSR